MSHDEFAAKVKNWRSAGALCRPIPVRRQQCHKGSANNYGKGCNVVLKRNGSWKSV